MKFLAWTMIALSTWCGQADPTNVRQLREGDLLFSQMYSRAVAWQQAVVARDVDVLVDFTWPEYRSDVRQRLNDSRSELYRMILDDGGQERGVLIRTPEVSVFQQIVDAGPVSWFAICYAPASEGRKWPSTFLELLWLPRSEVFCSYWVNEPEGVFISYDFGIPDPADRSRGEVITTQVSTTTEARRQLESTGWWPPLIPDAATAIVEAHDLDTNGQKIMFAIESAACRRAVDLLPRLTAAELPRVPDLRMEGWPAWLSGASADTLRRRGATAARTEKGTLLLVCDDEQGYFWR